MYVDPSGHNPECGPDGIFCGSGSWINPRYPDKIDTANLSDYVYRGTGVSGQMMYEFYLQIWTATSDGRLTVKNFVEMIMSHEFEPYQNSNGTLNFEPGSILNKDLLKQTTANWYWGLHKGETTVTSEGMLNWIAAFGSAGMAYRAGSLTGTKASGLARDVISYVYSISGIARNDPTAPSTFGNWSIYPGLKYASQGTGNDQYIAMWPSLTTNQINLNTNPAYILSACQVAYQLGDQEYLDEQC